MSIDERPWRCPRDHTCPSPVHHDNARGYKEGCPSQAARDDVATLERNRAAGNRPRLVDATGVARRLQALHAGGHDDTSLAARLHVNRSRIGALRVKKWARVTTRTADTINWLYLELSETDGASDQARANAARRHYRPAWAWRMETIDDPDAKPLNAWHINRRGTAGQNTADPDDVARLLDAGRSPAQIAHELRVSTRTVERHAARLRRDQEAA